MAFKLGIATCLIAALVGLPVLKNRMEKTTVLPTATALLTESKHAYEIAVPPHGAEHRTFAFEVRSDNGSLVDSGKVETYKSRIPNRSASRLLSSAGKLIDGRWIDGTGRLTTYSSKRGLHRPSNTSNRNRRSTKRGRTFRMLKILSRSVVTSAG